MGKSPGGASKWEIDAVLVNNRFQCLEVASSSAIIAIRKEAIFRL